MLKKARLYVKPFRYDTET